MAAFRTICAKAAGDAAGRSETSPPHLRTQALQVGGDYPTSISQTHLSS